MPPDEDARRAAATGEARRSHRAGHRRKQNHKLEFLVADALAQGSDSVITAGGPQSNHCRQTAAAAAIAGLKCHLILGGQPQPPVGNLLLDQLLGATIHWTPKPRRNARIVRPSPTSSAPPAAAPT